MKIIITPNDDLEGYDLIDTESDQSHDGDNAKEVIATVYGWQNALIIRQALETEGKDHKWNCPEPMNDGRECNCGKKIKEV